MVKINGLHGLLGGVPASESYDNFSTFWSSSAKRVEKSHAFFDCVLMVAMGGCFDEDLVVWLIGMVVLDWFRALMKVPGLVVMVKGLVV